MRAAAPGLDGVDAVVRPAVRSRVEAEREAEALAHERAGRRDDAIRVLMRTYGDGVRGYARNVLGDDELAKDVRQQVFIEAWRHLDQFAGRASLWSWLCGIAYHRCVDAARRRGRSRGREVALDPGVVDVLEAASGTSERSMSPEAQARREALARCLARLPDAMRAQVLMRYVDGLSHGEIGAIVGDTAGTVQIRLARILPRLHRCLRAAGETR